MIENVDRRVLAGFQCVDAITSSSIESPLSVTGTPLTIRANRSGVFAVLDGPDLRPLTTQFLASDPAAWAAPATYEITIQDPALRYLPRRANIVAPQPLPATGTTPPPVTTPQQILMYPVTAAPLSPNWAVIRVSVVSNATPAVPLPWAVVQITGAGASALSGLTNQNGEALLAIPGLGLKLSSSSTGAITETTTAATVTAYFDPTVFNKPKGWVPNPDDLLLNLSSAPSKSTPQQFQVGPGQTVFVTLTISM